MKVWTLIKLYLKNNLLEPTTKYKFIYIYNYLFYKVLYQVQAQLLTQQKALEHLERKEAEMRM